MALVEFLCLLTNQYFVFVSVSCFLYIRNLSQFPMTFVLDLSDQILLKNLKVVLILKYIDLEIYCLLKMKNNQSLYNRFPRNCCHWLLQISFRLVRVSLLQWRKITYFIFFSGEGERSRDKRRVKKRAGDSEEIGTIVSVE